MGLQAEALKQLQIWLSTQQIDRLLIYSAHGQALSAELKVPSYTQIPETPVTTTEVFDCVLWYKAGDVVSDHFSALQTCIARLKVGGAFILVDTLLPEDKRAARYVRAFRRLLNSSHKFGLAEYQWRGLFQDVGLEVIETAIFTGRKELLSAAQVLNHDAQTITRLQVMLLQMPTMVRGWLKPRYAGSPYATFTERYIGLFAHKGE